jgi:hypothetical protein
MADDADVHRAAIPYGSENLRKQRLGFWSQLFRILFEIKDEACGPGRLRRQSLPEDPFDLRFLKSRRRARCIVRTLNCSGVVVLVYHLSARPVRYRDLTNLSLWVRNQKEHASLSNRGWWAWRRARGEQHETHTPADHQ